MRCLHGRGRACPRCHGRPLDDVAYAHLLGLYLGDGHIVRCRNDVFQLSLFCGDAYPGLIEEAAAVMAGVMPASSVSRRRRRGCTEVKSYSTHWPCLFPQHGPGMKHTREIKLADWQPRYMFKNESADILALCGQGLDLLGVAWRYNNRNELSVARREAVELLDAHVGAKY
ncbi:hypothetical protein [Nonomuraea antri]|uniref:hypothetical protein n=1 Tax=Nonomuraea antri TaxID=2730852 RepID=UPI001F4600B1|nr:hypothetical protein [Nonomuraea antri]